MEPTPLDEILSTNDSSKGDSRPRDDRGRWVSTPEPEALEAESTPPEPQAQAAPEPTPQPERAAPEPEAPAAPPPSQPRDPVRGLEAGIAAERDKRQAVERQFSDYRQAMEQRFAALEARLQQPAPMAPQAPQFDVNQDALFSEPAKVFDTFGQQIQSRIGESFTNQALDMAEWTMRRFAPDYDEARAAFLAASQRDPALKAGAAGKAPYELVEHVYAQGKELLNAEKQRWMERLRPEFEKQFAAPSQQAARPVAPQSLNAEPSPSAPVVEFKPTPLGKALRTKL